MKPEPTACLLHGFLGDPHDWDPVIPTLGKKFHCLLPCLPGHGSAAQAPVNFDEFHWPETDVLIGYSLGARIALDVLGNGRIHPKAIVLESASPGLQDPDERLARLEQDKNRSRRLREVGLDVFLKEWYDQPLFSSLRDRPELLREILESRVGNAALLAEALEHFSPGRMVPRWDWLAHCSIPILVLAGQLDEKGVALAQRMEKASPCVSVRIVSGAGHNIHRENPEAWLRETTPFLEANL